MEMNTPDEADEKEICLTFTKTMFHSRKKKCFKLEESIFIKHDYEKNQLSFPD